MDELNGLLLKAKVRGQLNIKYLTGQATHWDDRNRDLNIPLGGNMVAKGAQERLMPC